MHHESYLLILTIIIPSTTGKSMFIKFTKSIGSSFVTHTLIFKYHIFQQRKHFQFHTILLAIMVYYIITAEQYISYNYWITSKGYWRKTIQLQIKRPVRGSSHEFGSHCSVELPQSIHEKFTRSDNILVSGQRLWVWTISHRRSIVIGSGCRRRWSHGHFPLLNHNPVYSSLSINKM